MKISSPWNCSLHVGLAALWLALVPGQAGSLWSESGCSGLVADKTGRAVGDLLTILVQESNTASKDNSTQTSKKASVDASITSFLYGPEVNQFLSNKGKYPSMKYEAANAFNGGGTINNAENLTARIAVRIIDVLPNRTLVIEGTRQITFANETQEAVLRGVVRSEDVSANNIVFSYNVANVSIKYISRGAVSDSQKRGWFTRVWDKLSPF